MPFLFFFDSVRVASCDTDARGSMPVRALMAATFATDFKEETK